MPFSVRYSSSASVVESGFTVEVVEVASPTASFFVPVRRADGALAWGPVVVSCAYACAGTSSLHPCLGRVFFFYRDGFGRLSSVRPVWACARMFACTARTRTRRRGGAVGGGGGRSKEPIADRAVAQRCFFVYDGLLGVCLRLGCELLHRREY